MRLYVFDAYEQSGIEREYMYHGVKTVLRKKKKLQIAILSVMYIIYTINIRHILQ